MLLTSFFLDKEYFLCLNQSLLRLSFVIVVKEGFVGLHNVLLPLDFNEENLCFFYFFFQYNWRVRGIECTIDGK